MKLGIALGYAGARVEPRFDLVLEADRLGYDSVWAAEAYGSDAVSVLAWCGAITSNIKIGSGILQMPARTPAMTAMTAATLSELTGGRFILGLGMSGPQVVEGWHGQPYGRPLATTREYVEIVRRILARKERLEHHGDRYLIPYSGDDATGLGKPLKLTIHPQHDVPVYLAAIGPRNTSLAAEIADGWLPFWYSPYHREVFRPHLEAGFAASGEADKADRFEIAVSLPAAVTDDPDQARWGVKPLLALYVGGMGARGTNFYFDLMCRYGYEEAATRIQEAYLDGRKEEAVAAVPDELIDEVALIGPAPALRDRLEAWEESGVTTLVLIAQEKATLRDLAELV